MFHDARAVLFRDILESRWREIHREYRAIVADLSEWVEPELYEGSWKVFPLFEFPHGKRIEAHASRCPLTAGLVDAHFPGHGVAGFSVLGPGTVIRPHQGYQGPYLRCHLGLEVPHGDCGLSSQGETQSWAVGKVLVFDDRATHEAWNRTGEDRVILLVDFPSQA